MAWPSWFVNHLTNAGRQYRLMFAWRRIESASGLDSEWKSTLGGHYLPNHRRAVAGWSMEGQRISMRSWQSNAAGYSILVQGDSQIRAAMSALNAGSIVGMYAGQPDRNSSDWALLRFGQLTGTRMDLKRGLLLLQFAGALASLRQRWVIDGDGILFANAGTATTLSADYTAGDAKITVTSPAALERRAGSEGVVQVTPSGGGTPFYLKYSNVSGSDLNGLTRNLYGTSDADALSGSIVKNVVLLEGNPLTILLRLLLSSGTANFSSGAAGSNDTTYDVYPETWGYNLPSSLVDRNGIAARKTIIAPDSGQATWSLLIEEPVHNGLTFFREMYAKAGIGLIERQGQISAYVIQAPYEATLTSGIYLSDADMCVDERGEPLGSFEPFDSSVNGTYKTVRTYTQSGSSPFSVTASIQQVPVFPEYEIDLSMAIRDNENAQRTEVGRRQVRWLRRRPGVLRSPFSGLSLAQAAPGDVVFFSSPMIGMTIPPLARNGLVFDETPFLITELATDWHPRNGGRVEAGLHVITKDT